MQELSPVCPYRSPKAASLDAARGLYAGETVDFEMLETPGQYNPDRDYPHPRAIETKAGRFAITAVLLEQVADQLLVGEGTETRMPMLQELRGRKGIMPYCDNEPLLKLAEDWTELDCTAIVTGVLQDPANSYRLDSYQHIVEDILTDPNDDDPVVESDDAAEELSYRIDPARSLETEIGTYSLIKWSLELLDVNDYPTSNDRRLFIINNIPFLEELSKLEITHAERYFHNKWLSFDTNAAEAGVELRTDIDGNVRLRLTERKKRPDRGLGKPIGCPAGFNLHEDPNEPAPEVLEPVKPDEPADNSLTRYIVAYVNEAYDRGII